MSARCISIMSSLKNAPAEFAYPWNKPALQCSMPDSKIWVLAGTVLIRISVSQLFLSLRIQM
jgi:hypothetical protein